MTHADDEPMRRAFTILSLVALGACGESGVSSEGGASGTIAKPSPTATASSSDVSADMSTIPAPPPTTDAPAPTTDTPTTAPATTEAVTTTDAATTTTVGLTIIDEGVYIVGVDIQPGIYRVVGYWARLDAQMEIIDNDGVYDNGLTLLNIQPTDAYVEISGEAAALGEFPFADPITAGFTEGTYLVNWDIPAGRYRVSPVDGHAYWARLDSTGDTIDNNISEGELIVIVQPGDWALRISGLLSSV